MIPTSEELKVTFATGHVPVTKIREGANRENHFFYRDFAKV